MIKVLLGISMLLGFLGFNPNEGNVENVSNVQVVVEDDNNYEFQQYVLACTREWTAAGYTWCTLDDAEHVLPQEIWESFMQQAEASVWSAYRYADDSYVKWKTEDGYTTYTLMCMCEQYYPGFSFTPLAEYVE